MSVKKWRKLSWAIGIASMVILFLGLDRRWLSIVGLIVMAGSIIADYLYVRCPYCFKHLGRDLGEYCPHCGKEIEPH